MSPKLNPKFKCALFLLIPTLSFEGRDTHMVPENLHKTPFLVLFTTLLGWTGLNTKKNQMVCTNRQNETDWDTFFFKKKPGPSTNRTSGKISSSSKSRRRASNPSDQNQLWEYLMNTRIFWNACIVPDLMGVPPGPNLLLKTNQPPRPPPPPSLGP